MTSLSGIIDHSFSILQERLLSSLAFEIGIVLYMENRITDSFLIFLLIHQRPLLSSDSFIELYRKLIWEKSLKIIWSKHSLRASELLVRLLDKLKIQKEIW